MTGIGRYIFYLRYVFGHKWHVARHCFKHGIYFRGLTHDMSKFLPSEFFAYLRYWTKHGPIKRLDPNYLVPEHILKPYRKSVALHKKRNSHHPEYWLHKAPDGQLEPTDMDDKAILEMICDWESFYTKFPGRKGAVEGYREFGHEISLSPQTRKKLEEMLRTLDLTEN